MAKTKKKAPRRRPPQNGYITDGTLKIAVKGGEHDGETIEMDLMLLRLAAEESMKEHPLSEVTRDRQKMLEPTAEFAMDLTNRLKRLGYKCSPAIAVNAWLKMCDYFADVQKKTR